jgi:hypothetical protein
MNPVNWERNNEIVTAASDVATETDLSASSALTLMKYFVRNPAENGGILSTSKERAGSVFWTSWLFGAQSVVKSSLPVVGFRCAESSDHVSLRGVLTVAIEPPSHRIFL